jgi:hypothetical protein
MPLARQKVLIVRTLLCDCVTPRPDIDYPYTYFVIVMYIAASDIHYIHIRYVWTILRPGIDCPYVLWAMSPRQGND